MEQRELNELASNWPRRPLRQHTPRHYLVHFLWPTSPTSGNLPKENLLILKTSGGSAATGTVSRKMMCRNCKKKLNIVITPGTYLPMCKKFYRKWWRKLSKYKDLTYFKKKKKISMERISSLFAEYLKVLCSSQVLITARAVPAKRVCSMGGKRVLDSKNYQQTSV